MLHTYYLLFLDLFAVIFTLTILRVLYYRWIYYLHVFQQLGYKSNELRGWLKDHWDEKVIPRSLVYFLISTMLLIFGAEFFKIRLSLSAEAIILFSWGIAYLGSTKAFRPKKVKKPLVWTARVKRLSLPFGLFSLILPLLAVYLGFVSWFNSAMAHPRLQGAASIQFDAPSLALGLALGYVFIPLFLLISGLLTAPIERQVQNGYKRQARKKLTSLPQLKVIAITGSYGKTSVKFMLRDVLKERFSVCVTPGSFNTPMGICKVINNDLKAHHQILILEMGARYAGNISELCDIAQPDISIVSNVGLAHLETFGSQEVIAIEKGTLVDRLKKGGVAVLNGNDPNVSKMGIERNDIQRIHVGLSSLSDTNSELHLSASEVDYSTEGTRFTLHRNSGGSPSESWDIQCTLLGKHNVQNLLLALGVGDHLGLRMNTMQLAASQIEPIQHRLELKAMGNYFMIDDAFNSNPVGAKNAVEILGAFSSVQRFIITPGMVELGDIEAEENHKFGAYIAKAKLDFAFIVGLERGKVIEQGYLEAGGDPKRLERVESLFVANEKLKQHIKPGDVVLYENDLPDIYNE